MQILVTDVVSQTVLCAVLLGAIFLATFVKKKNYTPLSLTQELKGFAILTIVFAHIGYYLSSNTQFLFPLSILAGVGVNLFYFLSGYGLTLSQLKRNENPLQFYKRRLLKIFIPFWIVLIVLFSAAYVVHGIIYAKLYVFKAFFGIFTSADLYADINSPLWYLTLLLFFYFLFPLLFSKKYPWLTALILYGCAYVLVTINFPALYGVIGLYQVHILAFPLGVLAAWLVGKKLNVLDTLKRQYANYERFLYPTITAVLLCVIGYLAINANVGKAAYLEQDTALITMFAIVFLFALKKRESKLLSLFGLYSYEIYLFHWPLMYHYDVIYKYLPAGLSTLIYLAVFVVIAFILSKLSAGVSKALHT